LIATWVGARGRAELDEHAEGVHSSEIDVDLKEDTRGKDAIIADLRAPGGCCQSLSTSNSRSRTDSIICSLACAPRLPSKIVGEDPDILRVMAEEFRARLSRIEGLTDLQVEKQMLIPQLDIMVDYTCAALYALQPQAVTEHLEITAVWSPGSSTERAVSTWFYASKTTSAPPGPVRTQRCL
jgi:HME family heavy-metal exporter